MAVANSQTRYTLMGKAVHNGTAQGYQLEVVDDGTGKLKGQNVSIVENGRKIFSFGILLRSILRATAEITENDGCQPVNIV